MGFPKGAGLLELPGVREQIEKAVAYATGIIGHQLRGTVNYCISEGCADSGPTREPHYQESPLEAIFFAWFYAHKRTDANPAMTDFDLLSQQTRGRYRFDFVVTFGNQVLADRATKVRVPAPLVGIELDGHEFHERTREQVAYRNRRDRDLQMAGWTVFHFAGSELHRDPLACVEPVFQFCQRAYEAWCWAVCEAETVAEANVTHP